MSTKAHHAQRPAVTIGMPVYNGGGFIGEALDSLLSQTFSDFELIISDNASTDQTETICREYASRDGRIKYIRQAQNLGAEFNFRFVFERAESEYFMWAAHDDKWSANWIEELIGHFSDQDAGLFGQYLVVGATKAKRPAQFLKGEFSRFFLLSYKSGKDYYSYALFRTQVLRKAMFTLMHCRVGGDELFLLSLLNYGNLRSIDNTLFYYRSHADSDTFRRLRSYGSSWRRLIISGFPFEYYKLAIAAVPDSYRRTMFLLIPLKYCCEQLRLWGSIPSRLTRVLRQIYARARTNPRYS